MPTQLRPVVDKLLTNSSRAYVPKGYIADQIFTPQKSKESSGKLAKYGTGHLRILNDVMGGRGGAKRIDVMVRGSDSYNIEKHGLEDVVTEEDYRNAEDPFDAENDSAIALKTVTGLGREKAMADALTSTAILTVNTTLSGSAQFSDYANSDPLGKIGIAKRAIRAGCGTVSDLCMIMDWRTADILSYHPALLESLGYKDSRPGALSYDEIAKAFKVNRLLVADVMYNTAVEGQTDSLGAVWGKDIVLLQAPTSPGKYQTTAGYTVRYANDGQLKVYKYAIQNPANATGIQVNDSYDDVIVDVNAAYLIKAAVA